MLNMNILFTFALLLFAQPVERSYIVVLKQIRALLKMPHYDR